MKVPRDIDRLSIVKVSVPGDRGYSVRYLDGDGVEHPIFTCGDLDAARHRLQQYGQLDHRVRACLIAMDSMYEIARRIELAGDDTGTGTYATKSHMRAWAAELGRTIVSLFDVLTDGLPKDAESAS